ncbi:MAG: prepilin-type N-terminal cleavage/methylation domain-containing protein [Phycisphaerales bacterium]|nr:prepilin-type N-terminal cleavage/methylation domain-containing protein [Phycisphaerales bacterium]
MSLRRYNSLNRPNGFTMTEVMVTIGIIVILLSILLVTVGGVRETARVASTRSIMTAMSQATSRFREDTGYLPPILDNDRRLVEAVPITSTSRGDGAPKYLHDMQGWYSFTSPAEYLVGYGGEAMDGKAGLGIRNPGRDGIWGASLDSDGNIQQCPPGFNRQPDPNGLVLGPYLDLKDDKVIASLGWDEAEGAWDSGSIDPSTGQPAIYYPGDAGYNINAPKVVVDAWGTPIRYYRTSYPTGDPSGSFPANYRPFPMGAGDGAGALSEWQYRPRLSEFIALRPWEIDESQATDYFFTPGGSSAQWGDFNDLGSGVRGDSTTTASLESGQYAFLSAGPDRRIFNWHRTDYLDRGGNDGSTFRNWLGHRPSWSADSSWYPDGRGSYCRSEPWYQDAATEEVNRDNIREVGP